MRARLFDGAVALSAAAGAGLEMILSLAPPNPHGLAGTVIEYFSYFTLDTNVLVAVAMGWSALAPESGPGKFFSKPGLRAAITLYILLVALVYHFMLRELWTPHGWEKISNFILHYVTPVMMLSNWLLISRKDGLRLSQVPAWMAFPAVYATLVLLRGQLTGMYPYGFLNVAEIGWRASLTHIVELILAMGLAGCVMVVAARRLPQAPLSVMPAK
ncbi:Pr6Pr family membrane protein [Hyphomonas chukchiensis]|uniref:FAR-17a/AIG1-like protein n=1 Tax=Hyphomonas chukchiensis TaxID=1280947 RepID=A0A062UKV7_9PROT|nr:Pr6Pr family membrane protein [Hyphomonas chukchiensis]KCZ60196.1 hypothetical protein HY30_12060 [Hyphomonas chukchiensis]